MQTLEAIEPIQQNSLADLVVSRIRQAIVLGQFKPGERLSEPALAATLGVSRSPVREALQRLQLEGLVIGQTNRTCTVWNPTVQDVREILSLRIMIESLATEWCFERLTEDDFAEMERLIDAEQRCIDAGDYVGLIREDEKFHEYICLRASHSRLLEWWHQIMGQWEVLIYRRLVANPAGVIPTVITDHHMLLDALRSRDKNRVISLHREINERVIENTAAVLNS